MLREPRQSCLDKIQEGYPGKWREVQRGLGGVKEGGERVFLVVGKTNAHNSGCLLLGPSPQRKGGRGLVSGFSVAGF